MRLRATRLSSISGAIRNLFTGASLRLQFAGATELDPRITFTRASSATFTGSDGLLQTAAVNVPRLTYNATTLAAEGLLVEEQRTNLLLWSQDLSQSSWTKGGTVTLDAAVIDPFGNTGTVYYPAVSEVYQPFNGGGASSIALSFFGRKRTGTANDLVSFEVFQQTSGTVVALPAYRFSLTGTNADTTHVKNVIRTALPNGWFRFACQVIPNTGAGLGNFSSSARLDIEGGIAQNYVWGIQLEAGAFATSYIPTTTAQATRAADVAVMTGTNFSSWYNQSEGTLVTSLTSTVTTTDSNYPRLLAVVGTDVNSDEISIYTRSQSGTVGIGAAFASITASGVTTFDPANVNNAAGAWTAAIAYKSNDASYATAGTAVATDISVTLPTGVALRLAGTVRFQPMPGSVTFRSITYYPRRLANTELQALTS